MGGLLCGRRVDIVDLSIFHGKIGVLGGKEIDLVDHGGLDGKGTWCTWWGKG